MKLRALETDPFSPSVHVALALSYWNQRKYDEAIRWANKTLDLDPLHGLAREFLAGAYWKLGDFDRHMAENLKHAAAHGRAGRSPGDAQARHTPNMAAPASCASRSIRPRANPRRCPTSSSPSFTASSAISTPLSRISSAPSRAAIRASWISRSHRNGTRFARTRGSSAALRAWGPGRANPVLGFWFHIRTSGATGPAALWFREALHERHRYCGIRTRLSRTTHPSGRCRLRHRACAVQRHDRQAPGADRALRERGGRHQRRELRARPRVCCWRSAAAGTTARASAAATMAW